MSVNEIFSAFKHQNVLIIGDVMIDSYIFGKVERISPEAPVPVVSVKKKEQRLGGAGNVALNIQAMGANPILCTIVGNDAHARELINLLRANNLETAGIIESKTRITTVKERIMAGSQHVVRIDSEIDTPINKTEQKLLLETVLHLAKNSQVIIFEDYDKGVLTKENIEAIITFAKENGIPTIVDPKKRNFMHYAGVDLFKPNLKELKEGLKIDFEVDNFEQLKELVSKAKEKLKVGGVLLTMSEHGVYIDLQGEQHHLAAHIRQIADVSGAGDTVVSIAALCLALNLAPKTIAEIANLGGGLVCESVGVIPIDKEKLRMEALKVLN